MAKSRLRYQIYIIIFWLIIIFPFVFMTVLFTKISNGKLGFMPSFEDLENPSNNLASEVYSTDDQLLGKYYIQNRTYVNYSDLSPYLIYSLKAAEDIRFEKHAGIDARGIARVIVKTLIMRQSGAGGGSTITQQLAKNLFPRDTVIYKSKISREYDIKCFIFSEDI